MPASIPRPPVRSLVRPTRSPVALAMLVVVAALGLEAALGTSSAALAQPSPEGAPPPREADQTSPPADAADSRTDPLILRLDALGRFDPPVATRDADGSGPTRDIELRLTSDPPGYSLLAARALETGVGTERRQCRAPCTTYLEPGSYRLVVENRRGRDRGVPGLVSLLHDGELELHIDSRRWARVIWWSASLALVAGGLTIFIEERQPVPNNDPYCEINCFHIPAQQRAYMTVGGLMAMAGAITLRFGISDRDVGRVVFRPARARPSTGTEEGIDPESPDPDAE
jgi:hypothetical protein